MESCILELMESSSWLPLAHDKHIRLFCDIMVQFPEASSQEQKAGLSRGCGCMM